MMDDIVMPLAWMQIFRHMPEAQFFCDKFHHVLLLDNVGK
jgi:hypothetical protein